MKILKIYEGLIREEEATQKANHCIVSFGEKLFADQLGGNEPNTPKEDNLVKKIAGFTVSDFGSNVNYDFVDALKELKLCVSEYPEILKSEGTVYRAIRVSFRTIFGNTDNINNDIIPYEYKARGVIQSWSENFNIVNDKFGWGTSSRYLNADIKKSIDMVNTMDFDEASEEEKLNILKNSLPKIAPITQFSIPFILKTEANENEFLFKAKYFKKLSRFEDEDEVLRVGNKPLNCIAMITPGLGELCRWLKHFEKELMGQL